ncbi:integral membrane protein [Parvularcula bermudensis HTCC2503]|uniref:Integral membrane protein n=1 Tax=Parvularcula bermudensis (strain ATCC BAA-594 / HTCC2503 / KCTC 12087) TaxID=314260 RepID=E0TGQ5_PARBH|nr:EamA family transporter [Parvularcula bermudensis]ADM10664.1 integral membrane protein [Parvularcula bermudensis HTCC2503]
MTPFRGAVLLMVCTLWGLHIVVVRATVDDVPALLYVALRMSLVAVLLIPFLRWHKGRMRPILVAGLCFGGFNYAFLFNGLRFVPAGVGALLVELYVPIAMGLSILLLGERVGWRRGTGAALAVLGAVIIVTGEGEAMSGATNLPLGAVLLIAGAFCEALGAILIKRVHGVSALQLLAWFGVVGGVVSWGLTIVLIGDQVPDAIPNLATGGFVSALIYSAIGASIMGHASYYWLLQRVDVTVLAPSGVLTTVIAVTAGTLFLDEPLTARLIVGGALTLLGVGIIAIRSAKKATTEASLPVGGPEGVRIQEPSHVRSD